MKKTIFLSVLVVSVIIIALAGAAQSQADKGPFSDVWSALRNEIAARIAADEAEVAARIAGDNSLQNQIDSIDIGNGGNGTQPTAFIAFLQVEGIEGESTDAGHKGWIEVLGHGQQITPRGHGEFKVTKLVDKSSPLLYLYASQGQHVEEVTLEVVGPNGIMQYNMTNVVVKEMDKSSPKLALGGGGQYTIELLPLEEVTFGYGQIRWEYTVTGPGGGTVSAGWDTVESRPIEEVPF